MAKWKLDVLVRVLDDNGSCLESMALQMPMRDHESARCAKLKVSEAVHEALTFWSRVPTTAPQEKQ